MSLDSLFAPIPRQADHETRQFVDGMKARLPGMPLEQMVMDKVRQVPECTIQVGLCPNTYVPDTRWACEQLTQVVRKRLGQRFSVQIADYGDLAADRQRSMSVLLVAQRPHGGYNMS